MQSTTPADGQPLSPDEARRARRRVAAEARKRIANACLACKSRKQKCDGQQPCNICSRRGADCVYVEQPSRNAKRRRPSSNVNASVAGDAPSELTRSTRSPSITSGPNQQGQHVRWDRSSVVEGPDGGSNSSLQSYAYPTPSSANPRLEVPDSLAGNEAGGETDEERVEAPVDHKTRLLSDPSGRLIYMGETATLTFLARVRKLVKDTLGQSSFTSDTAQNSIVDRPVIPRIQYNPDVPRPVPPFDCATVLVDLFFKHVNSVHYVLDREEMDQIRTAVYGSTNVSATTGDRNVDFAVMNAVCAVGTFFTPNPQMTAMDGMRYFDAARIILDDAFEAADFWSVRLLLLFSIYMQYASKRNASWIYIGLAIRVAESLGLHRISEHSESFQGDRNPERRGRLVFWSLYCVDGFTGCAFGRPLAIQDENCNDPIFAVDGPVPDDPLLDGQCDSTQSEDIHQIHLLAAKVRLYKIIGHIVRKVYLKRSISRDVAESLSDELKAWWRSLKPCASLNNGTDPPVIHLHMTYLHAVALLTRPFLSRVVEASVEESPNDGDCQCKRRSTARSNVRRKMLRYAGACVLVAERTIALAHRMRKTGILPKNDATLIYYLFTAGLILMFSVVPQVLCPREDHGSGEDDTVDFQTRSNVIVSLMGECASLDACTAKRYHSVLSQFAQALSDGKERRQREEQAQKTLDRDFNTVEESHVEPDLLDELQNTSNEYFAGTFQSRGASSEPASRESVAAHALVAVASNGQLPPHQDHMLSSYLESGGTSAMINPGDHYEAVNDSDFIGMPGSTDFSSFFGWLQDPDGLSNSESPAVPWEVSWDYPESNYFLTSFPRPM